MRVVRLYTAQTLSVGGEIILESAPSHHLATVLRAKADQPVELFNGDGNAYAATIVAITKKQVTVTVSASVAATNESPLQIHLGIGVSKGERFDFVLQKSTELGVAAITPLISSRTEVKLGAERGDKKMRHWQQIIIAACEQSGRNYLPALAAPEKINEWINGNNAERKFVLHHRADITPLSTPPPQSVALLIGPEGGLSNEEITAAEKAGFVPWRLGPRILRTETAPLAAITALQWTWGDMHH